jgi:phosphoribosylglycinamide formyltransferase-1
MHDRTVESPPRTEVIHWPEIPVATERVGITASGSGSTFEAIATAWLNGEIEGVDYLVLIATAPGIGALERAEKLGIPAVVVDLRDETDFWLRGALLKEQIDRLGVQFVHHAGMTKIIEGSILEVPMTNTHPAPMADNPHHRPYGGPGMIGMRVHERMCDDYLDHQITRAGSTMHLVDSLPDHGGIVRVTSYDIAKRACSEGVDPRRVTSEHLSAWTQADEKRNNSEVLATITREGKLRRLPDVRTDEVAAKPRSVR